MEIYLSVNLEFVDNPVDATHVLVIDEYENLIKNKFYNIYVANGLMIPYIIDENFDESYEPLGRDSDDILVKINVNT